MEHVMDKIAMNNFVQFIDYIYQCPLTGEDWISNFNTFFAQNKIAEANCPECLDDCLKRFRESPKKSV
jgi:DtxR family Mn-dependent transcriptional regulator